MLHLFAGNATSDKTEGKKKGRPKAENQALKDIPVRARMQSLPLPCSLHHPLVPALLC